MISTGTPAPSISAQTDTGSTISLDEFRGTWVVLFFYPKAGTAG